MMTPIRIRWDMRLTERAVLKHLANLEKPKSQKQIAQELDCNHATLERTIKRLKDKGVLTVNNEQSIARYEIHLEKLPDYLREEIARKS